MASENKLWHDTATTWPERNKYLFDKDFMSDCSFIVEENDEKVKIPSHKYILGGVSLDFYNLFYLMEPETNEIPITDVSLSYFKVFLKYVYTGETDLTMENLFDVFKLANRFSIKSFKDYCEKFFSKQLNKSNYLKMMDTFSKELSSAGMENLFLCFMNIMSGEDILVSESFLEIKHETLAIILSFQQSRVKEVDLFLAASKWAGNNCEKNGMAATSTNKRSVLGKAFMNIRFASMTFEEFTQCIKDDSILTTNEENQIFRFIGNGGKSDCIFSDIKRMSITGMQRTPIVTKKILLETNEPPVPRFKLNSFKFWHFTLCFELDKPVKIGGFGIKLNFHTASTIPEMIRIKLTDNSCNTLLENDVEIWVTEDSKLHDLLFKESFMLESNAIYNLEFELKYQVLQRQYGGSLLSKLHSHGIIDDFYFTNYNKELYCSIVNIGLVE